MIQIYTDGGYSIPREEGGWAMVVVDESLEEKDRVLYTENGTQKDSTSNRMEMTAFLTALIYAQAKELKELEIITDSNYVVQGYNTWSKNWKAKGWKKADGKPIKNKDLWLEIDNRRIQGLKVTWTKGHNLKSGTKESYYNDMCDRLTRDYE